MDYADPIIAKYIDLIRANNGVIKAYYQGEPLRLPEVNLPCCIISKTATAVGPLNNADDEHSIGLRLTIITDVRQDISSEESNAAMVEGVRTLYEVMEGRNEDYTLKDTSILDILRSNINLDVAYNLRTDLGSITRVDYGTTMRERPREEWTVEARLDFTAHFTQNRNE